jgi:hypothetical protein
MEAVSSCETLVMINQTTEHYISEDINLIFRTVRIWYPMMNFSVPQIRMLWIVQKAVIILADKACHPELEQNKATFQLSLTNIFQCGVTRIHNQLTVRTALLHG